MKLLRILTGAHAGAGLRLSRERYVLGCEADADIVLTDWKEGPICLMLAPDEAVQVAPIAAAADAEPDVLEDLAPRRFGDVVLCVGPADAAWPSDLRLLEKLVRRKPRKPLLRGLIEMRAVPDRRVLIACGTLAVALMSGFVGVIGNGRATAATPEEPLQTKVARAIQAAGVTGVSVRAGENGSVSVEGMVHDGSEAARLRAALVPLGAQRIAHRYASAGDVAQAIGDALANPGLSVRYRGDGEFVVTGSSIDLAAVRGKLQRIVTDLGPAVAHIQLAAAELPPPATLATNALLHAGELRYVQTRDGTKHLVLTSPGPAGPDGVVD